MKTLAIAEYDTVQIGVGSVKQCDCAYRNRCVYNNGSNLDRIFNPTGYSVFAFTFKGVAISPPITLNTVAMFSLRNRFALSHTLRAETHCARNH